MAYEPDQLRLSKKEILEQFDIAIERLSHNRRENFKFIAELKAVKLMIGFTNEAKFPYFWIEIMKIIDSIRTLNELRGDPSVKKLAAIQEQKVTEAILEVPKPKVLVDFTKNIRFGGMKDG